MAPSTTRTCGAMAVDVAADLGGALIFLKLTIRLVFEGERDGSLDVPFDALGISLPSPESFKKYAMVRFSDATLPEVDVAIEAASFGPEGNLISFSIELVVVP